MLNLSPVEARVLGSLIEKEITTPEYYPLSLNALINACNQKSSREPVMELAEPEVRGALFELENIGLVRVIHDSRATKFEHLAYHKLDLRRPEIAVIGLLLLRGAQTPAELRARSERLYSFDDTNAVTDVLSRLAAREQPLVLLLGRQPGAREARWAHLLSGPVDTAAAASPAHLAAAPVQDERTTALEARVQEQEAQLQTLTERLQTLETSLATLESRFSALSTELTGA
ncbi:MAG: YceH family protein [Acidobacteriaceae bacterium]|nr:YceH family protein [Acidobacteriaceae bacterium]